MKVKELIKELEKMNQEMVVIVRECNMCNKLFLAEEEDDSLCDDCVEGCATQGIADYHVLMDGTDTDAIEAIYIEGLEDTLEKFSVWTYAGAGYIPVKTVMKNKHGMIILGNKELKAPKEL